MKKNISIVVIAIVLVLSISSQILAASSPYLFKINLSSNTRLQVRGFDKPHGIKTFGSYPGYDTFVHSNCYHVHGEYKLLSNGREISSKSVAIPYYCKGLTTYIKSAFTTAAAKLGLSSTAFLKVSSGVLFSILMNIPSVGNPQDTIGACNQNITTNSSACYWTVK